MSGFLRCILWLGCRDLSESDRGSDTISHKKMDMLVIQTLKPAIIKVLQSTNVPGKAHGNFCQVILVWKHEEEATLFIYLFI